VAIAALAVPGSLKTDLTAGQASSVAGCYRLVIGDWSEPEPYWAGFTPAQFKLDLSPLSAPLKGLVVEPKNPLITAFRGSWRILPEDSLIIAWGSMLGGVTLRLEHRGDVLAGRAQGETDARSLSEPLPYAPAAAIRVGCPERVQWADAR
jgi:hypothetical protein